MVARVIGKDGEPKDPVEIDEYHIRDGAIILRSRSAIGLGGPWEIRTSILNLAEIMGVNITERES